MPKLGVICVLTLVLFLIGCTDADDTGVSSSDSESEPAPTPTAIPATPTVPILTSTSIPVSPTVLIPTSTVTPAQTRLVSISELYELHSDNEPAFESLYLDQFVQIAGRVGKIDDDRVVEIWNESEERIFCRVPEANVETLVPVRPGMDVTVLGKISVETYVFLGTIIAIQDCYVLDYSIPPTPTNTPTSTPTDTPTMSPTQIPTHTPTITFTPTLTLTPLPATRTPTPTLSPTITLTPVSTFYEVGNTDGDGVYLRESAGGDERIKAWPDGTLMMVVGPDTLIDGRLWRYIQDPDGNIGYVPVEYLVKHVPPTATPTPTRVVEPTATPSESRQGVTITNAEAQDISIQTIKQYTLVRDAAIEQSGDQFNLALIVNRATNERYARELGDNFVRMLKAFSDDDSPGKAIGRGKYDYIITVAAQDGTVIALGAKARTSTRITWR